MDAPTHPIAGGLIQRKARDANGVADGAEVAVADAASNTGSSLPEPIMRKFESSLGTDLSSVRIHTGSVSAEAAHAVGARAYTVGQDIHFGAGQYDPASARGEHLLAHEVAHTVQQAHSTPTAQYKLEVSSPHDEAEREADRAADAMLGGVPVLPLQSGPRLSRYPLGIARDPVTFPADEITGPNTRPADTDQMAANADKAQGKVRERVAAGGNSDIGDIGAIVIQDKAGIDKTISSIQYDESNLKQGIAAGDVQPYVLTTNQQAIASLGVYSEVLGDDTFNNDSFLQQSQVLAEDFARLHAQMMTLDKSGQAGGEISNVAQQMPAGANRGERLGDAVLDVSSGQSAATLNKDFKHTIVAADKSPDHSTTASDNRQDVKDREKDMQDAEQHVAEGMRNLMPKQSAAQAATARLKSMAAAADAGKLQGEINKLQADAAAADEKIRLAGTIAKSAAATAFVATDPNRPNVGAAIIIALDLVTNLVAYSAKHFNDDEIAGKSENKKVAEVNEVFHRTNAAAKDAKAAIDELKAVASTYYDNLGNLAKAKKEYRDAMKLMGNSLDNVHGGNAFSIVAQVLAEAETYLVQSKLTIESGRNTVGTLPPQSGGPRHDPGTQGSVTYYVAVQPPDKHTYFASRGSIAMKGSLTSKGSVLAESLNKMIEKLEQERTEIEALAKNLRRVFKV